MTWEYLDQDEFIATWNWDDLTKISPNTRSAKDIRTQNLSNIHVQKFLSEQSHRWHAAPPCCSRSGQRVPSSSLDEPQLWPPGHTSKAPLDRLSPIATLSSVPPPQCGRASLPDGQGGDRPEQVPTHAEPPLHLVSLWCPEYRRLQIYLLSEYFKKQNQSLKLK